MNITQQRIVASGSDGHNVKLRQEKIFVDEGMK